MPLLPLLPLLRLRTHTIQSPPLEHHRRKVAVVLRVGEHALSEHLARLLNRARLVVVRDRPLKLLYEVGQVGEDGDVVLERAQPVVEVLCKDC